MKIVIISNYRIGNETGVAKVSETLSKSLSKRNEVLYICLGKDHAKKKINNNLTIVEIPSVPIKQSYIPKLTSKVTQEIIADLDSFKPDIVHTQNIVFASLVALIWSIKNNVSFLTTFHSLPSEGITWVYPKLSGNKGADALNYTFKSGYAKRFIKNVDLSIALNSYVEKSIKDVSPKARTEIVNNGLDLKNYFKLKTTQKKDRFKFIYLGSYIPKKNQEFLINAFSYLPKNYNLKLYGNKESGNVYVKKLEKLISELAVSNVELNDFISPKSVLKELEKSAYLVSASLKEAQSLVVIESLAAGNPVIGLSNETINEVINSKNGLRISVKSTPKAFANKLKNFVESSSSNYINYSKESRKTARNFDIDKVTEKLEKIYGREIERKKKSKIKVKPQIIKDLIPEKFTSIFESFNTTKSNQPFRLKYFLGITMIISVIFWPILKLIQFAKKDLK